MSIWREFVAHNPLNFAKVERTFRAGAPTFRL